MIARITCLLFAVSCFWSQSTWAAIAGQESQLSDHLDAVGRYSPESIDAGIVLDLAKDGTFVANWWAQDMKGNKIVKGGVVGKWHIESKSVVLTYSKDASKIETCKFQIGSADGKRALVLLKGAEFPLNEFFGAVYFLSDCASRE